MARLIKDINSVEWQRTRKRVNERLAEFRSDLELPGTNAIDSELVRGQILFAREILSWDQDDDLVNVPDTTYLIDQ